jgi:hypothetical protein
LRCISLQQAHALSTRRQSLPHRLDAWVFEHIGAVLVALSIDATCAHLIRKGGKAGIGVGIDECERRMGDGMSVIGTHLTVVETLPL